MSAQSKQKYIGQFAEHIEIQEAYEVKQQLIDALSTLLHEYYRATGGEENLADQRTEVIKSRAALRAASEGER